MDGATCPVARSLDAIGGWWALLIVREAFADVRRFSDFQKRLGLAKNILATRLRGLVAEGIL
jgi:DNA-binding HxlR family transcriptional regulator